jgi:hypothetical protein
LDETYAAGDGTDVWCSTKVKVPTEIVNGYTDPVCDVFSCFATDFLRNTLYKPFTKAVCLKDLKETTLSMNFICM